MNANGLNNFSNLYKQRIAHIEGWCIPNNLLTVTQPSACTCLRIGEWLISSDSSADNVYPRRSARALWRLGKDSECQNQICKGTEERFHVNKVFVMGRQLAYLSYPRSTCVSQGNEVHFISSPSIHKHKHKHAYCLPFMNTDVYEWVTTLFACITLVSSCQKDVCEYYYILKWRS